VEGCILKSIIDYLSQKIDRRSITRKSFLINCIVLTAISALIAVGSSKLLFSYDLPTENFVTVEISGFIEIPCMENEDFPLSLNDTGLSLNYDCEPQKLEVYTTRASAAAISRVDGQTFLLTAEHFCEAEESIESSIQDEIKSFLDVESIIYKDGVSYEFSIVKVDKFNDLCLISSEEYSVSENLRLARKMPKIGERTSTVSSPLGISEKGVSLHFSGTFSGCNDYTCFFTIPAISGSSGSLVLNYDQEIVGITQRSLVGFPEVTIGSGIEDITEFITEYERESGIDITP
tara:strand:+ start:132 stop:1001 length:870 start_codon:yes stop_codon:yes gene_type:complete